MQSCNILLLEDEPLILMDLEFAAEEKGCDAHCATGVAPALDIIENERVDVAILDVTLRDGENCVPVAMELGRRGVPFLLHSGDLNRADETVRELGARHVPKPCESADVIAAALSVLSQAQGAANGSVAAAG